MQYDTDISPDRQQMGCVVLVLSTDEKSILLGKRKNAYKAGLYGLPGGRVEHGERLETTAKRELLEETNLTAKNLNYLGVVKEAQEKFDFVHFAFTCSDYSGELQTLEPDKCDGWEWFKITEIPEDILPGHAAAIEFLQNSNGDTLKDV